jgi:hypothetical protein
MTRPGKTTTYEGDGSPILQACLRLAIPVYEAAGASILGLDTIHIPEFLSRAVVGLKPRWISLRYTERGFTISVQTQDRRDANGRFCYVAVALALAAHRAESGLWELRPGVEAPLMAAATVVLANGWAEVRP